MHTTPSRRPGVRRLAALFLLLVAACGSGGESALEQARLRLQRGDFAAADAHLRGVEGADAAALRDAIADARRRRAEVEQELARLAAEAPGHDAAWTRARFAALRERRHDQLTLERIAQAESDLASELAALRAAGAARKPRPATDAGAEREEAAAARASGSAARPASSAAESLAEARVAQAASRWRSALAHVRRAEEQGAPRAEVELVRDSIGSAARVEADALLGRAKELERSAGAAAAARLLGAELARFPEGAEHDRLRLESEILAKRAVADAPAVARAPGAPRAPLATGPVPASAARAGAPALPEGARAELALARQAAGDLRGAWDAWLEAARHAHDASERASHERRARECELRLALRSELADFARLDDQTAQLLGWQPAAGGEPRWDALAPGLLRTAAEQARVSTKAELGWCVEAILRGGEPDREVALARLGSAVVRGALDEPHASALVAQAKAAIGDGGWVFRGGRWLEGRAAEEQHASAERAATDAAHAALLGDFLRAAGAERDAAWERVLATGDRRFVASALSDRWRDDWSKLERNPNLRQLAQLADDRRALDQAREKALALIFDEERYFYPYNPPECPPDKAAKYAGVQREVNELVGAVKAIWEASKPVKLGEPLRQLLAGVAWTGAQAREAEVELAPPPHGLEFALCLPAAGEVGLPEFAWDAAERAQLVESERVEARNERLWTALERAKPAPDVPGNEEREQVRITNAYRRMLGRRSVAWNPRLQTAAQLHSEYMANTGDFSHTEQGDPARRTAGDRMKLAGYPRGISENISMGRGDPKSAHEGWTQSSGHHRNLLMAGHREMASGLASSYWTQNFGVDAAFLADL